MTSYQLLTCQTWVTMRDWFIYARHHPEQVPFLLADRSPCTDPFLDPYALSKEKRRPLISGLCRCIKDFHDFYIYVSRVDDWVCRALGIPTGSYLGIAALKVVEVHESHADAAATFMPRRYVVAPVLTPYPPNLAHDPGAPAAVLRESCIVSLDSDADCMLDCSTGVHHYTPDASTDDQWEKQFTFYHEREQDRRLLVAECRLVQVSEREALQLNPAHAPVFTPADWGGTRMNVNGIKLSAAKADELFQRIAYGR